MPSLVRLVHISPSRDSRERLEFGVLRLTDDERTWLKATCPYFHDAYLDYLHRYRFKPEQVSIRFIPSEQNVDLGDLEIEAVGPWLETILWEVPLMACLSELYFRLVDTDWNYDGQEGASPPLDVLHFNDYPFRASLLERRGTHQVRLCLQRVRHAQTTVFPYPGHCHPRPRARCQRLPWAR